MVDVYLEHLRRQRALVRPLTGGPLHRWKDTLGVPLPAALTRLYDVTDGTSGHEELPMRLMGHAEVLEMTDAFSDDLTRARTDPLFTFWTDDNSNFAVTFVEGPLAGMVGFLDHEEPWPVPEYATVESFLEALRGGAEFWPEMRREYPRGMPAPTHLVARERELKQVYLDRYRLDPDDRWAAFVAMQFLVGTDLEITRELMDSPEMWVQEQACRCAGALGMTDLIPLLEEIALHGSHNGQLASLVALRKLGTDAARQAMARLEAALPPGYEIYFR